MGTCPYRSLWRGINLVQDVFLSNPLQKIIIFHCWNPKLHLHPLVLARRECLCLIVQKCGISLLNCWF